MKGFYDFRAFPEGYNEQPPAVPGYSQESGYYSNSGSGTDWNSIFGTVGSLISSYGRGGTSVGVGGATGYGAYTSASASKPPAEGSSITSYLLIGGALLVIILLLVKKK